MARQLTRAPSHAELLEHPATPCLPHLPPQRGVGEDAVERSGDVARVSRVDQNAGLAVAYRVGGAAAAAADDGLAAERGFEVHHAEAFDVRPLLPRGHHEHIARLV